MKLQPVALAFVTACGGSQCSRSKRTQSPLQPRLRHLLQSPHRPKEGRHEPAPEVQIVVDDGTIITINLTANDAMPKFNTAEIKIAAGRTVKLQPQHGIGKMPAEMMGHNFVLLAEELGISAFSCWCDNEGHRLHRTVHGRQGHR